MLFIQYPKCTTCIKAGKWLDENEIKYESRNIKEENPTYEELKKMLKISGYDIKKFFNTSGILYRQLNLKEKLDDMTSEEKLRLLSDNGMLVKRPILWGDDFVLVGFKKEEWEEKLCDRY